MNVIEKCNFFKKSGLISIKKSDKCTIIENKSNQEETIIVTKVFRGKNKYFNINFSGDVIYGNKSGVIAKLVSKSREIFCEIPLNMNIFVPKRANVFMIALRMMPNTKVNIKRLDIDFSENCDEKVKEGLNSDMIVIVPGYPSYTQKYNFSFVHSKVRKYRDLGWNVNVLVVDGDEASIKYEFEGIKVTKTNYLIARDILQEKRYKKILVHFFKEEYANLLDAVDISESELYIYVHGADLIYRDYNIMTARYFRQPEPITNSQSLLYKKLDGIIEKYNKKKNVKWIFGTNWAKNRAEELNNIKFNKYCIIPCNIDNDIFKFQQKKEEDRTKIFTIKKFDDINTYSADILVRTILELSKRDFFNKLEFNIYGDGTEFERLLEPIADFENVKLNKGYLTHEEIAEVHKQNGIGLFPTRYETQGVSASEAAMSGLVVVSGKVAAVPEVFDNSKLLCEKENYIEYADKIEYLYRNPKEYVKLSKIMHDRMIKNYGNDVVCQLEKDMMDNNKDMKSEVIIPEQEENKILTIAIASYNVEKYIRNGVLSLLNSRVASKLEILIINDGSKDHTAKIGKELEKFSTINGKSIVKLVDKQNGGHGSTINKGIELATGKYFKLMDGDDYFDTKALEDLVDILEKEDCDMILNNYVEDLAVYSIKNEKYLYNFMVPGLKYNLEDLCVGEYGFYEWGPLLSTSTYKTEMLKKGNFKISEKCFYVDMELNTYAFINAKTVMYYPLNIYIYFLGRSGQSISKDSYMKNYKNHEHVILKLINEYYENDIITEKKREYISNKIIIPMVKCQYMIATEFFSNGIAFRSFDSKLKKYKKFYDVMEGRRIKIYRATNGKTIKLFHIMDSIKRKFKR